MGSKDDDNSADDWPWNDQTFQRMQAEHEKFMKGVRDQSRQIVPDIEENVTTSGTRSPFAVFKRLVDENLGVVTDHFKNFPSNVREIRANMQRAQEQYDQAELDISRRWTGSTDSPDHITLGLARATAEEKEDAHTATIMLLSEAYERNQHVPAEKIKKLFQDPESELGSLDRLASPMLALGGAWFFSPEIGDKLPTPSDWRWPEPEPRWLSVDWFKRSLYSPIRLEAHQDLGISGAKWRASFEDLLNASLDKALDSAEAVGQRQPHGKMQSTHHGPGLDWMLSLQCRGILPPLLPRFWSRCNATEDQPLRSLLQRFPWSSDQVSMGDKKPRWLLEDLAKPQDPLHEDFSSLMAQIATKSTSDSPFAPQERVALPEAQIWKTPGDCEAALQIRREFREPATEQDLYDDLDFRRRDEPVCPFGSKQIDDEDLYNPFENLWDALTAKNPKDVADVLDFWHSAGGDIEDLLVEVFEDLSDMADKLSILKDALKRADLPYGEEIEQRLEALAQQAANIEAMTTGGKKPTESPPIIKKPDVLSALTTTHTTRLPDGTVTTKVVLKQRFADGREETTESVHTTKDSVEQQKQKEAQTEDKRKGKGWFWSEPRS